MSQQDGKRRTLSSSAELKGGKKDKGGKKKLWIQLLSLVLVLGVAVGIYYLAPNFRPAEEEVEETPAPTSAAVKLIDRSLSDVRSVTVAARGQDSFTVNHNPTPTPTPRPTPRPTDATPEPTPDPTPEATEPGDDPQDEQADLAPTPTPEKLPEYTIAGHPGFLLDQSLARNMIGYGGSLSAVRLVEEGVTDLERFGLKDPALRATFQYVDGTSVTLLFGDPVPTTTQFYITPEGSRSVYTTYSTAFNTLSRHLNSLHMVNMPLYIDPMAIQAVLVEQAGKPTIEMKYVDASETALNFTSLRLFQPFPIPLDTHMTRSSEFFEALAGLTITGYAGTVEELPEAGFGPGEEPRARILVTLSDGRALDYRVGNRLDTNYFAVQVDETDIVYIAPASTLQFVENARPAYLVDQFANLVAIAKVDSLTVKTADDQFDLSIYREPELDAEGNQKVNSGGVPQFIETFYFEGEETDDLFKKIYQVIIGTMVSKESDDIYLDGDVMVTVTYRLNVAPGELVIEYIAYDEEYYAVRRDGLTLFLIKQSIINNMIAQLEEFRAGTFVAPKY